MKAPKRFVYCYLFCFLLIVTVDMLSSGDMPGDRMYLVLMPLLALSLFLFSDFSSEGIRRRIRGYRWSIMILLIGIVTSRFVDKTLSAGAVILVSSLIAPFLRIRRFGNHFLSFSNDCWSDTSNFRLSRFFSISASIYILF